MEDLKVEANPEVTPVPPSQPESEEIERKEAIWQQMNKGVSTKTLQSTLRKQSSTTNGASQKSSSQNRMSVLGLAPKRASSTGEGIADKCLPVTENGTSDDAKKLAAALSAVKDAAASGRGKVEVTERAEATC